MPNPITRILSCIAFLLLLGGCGTDDKKKTVTIRPADTVAAPAPLTAPKAPRTRNRMPDSMLSQIIGYYQNLYANDSVHMSISRSDTVVELSFADTTGGPDSYTGILLLANISLVTDVNPLLSGDLDGDGLEDLLVSVHTEGGGGGGNVWWNDHFVFLAEPNGQYTLADSKSDGELTGGSGYFFPDAIATGRISGVSNEYAGDDGHCCPSLYYRITLRLDKAGLTQVSKTAIPKPREFE